MNQLNNKPVIRSGKVTKLLLTINIIVATIYFFWWFFPGRAGNPFLYALLFFGEIYHVAMALFFWLTLWPKRSLPTHQEAEYTPTVDIYIPVAGEPIEIVTRTIEAAKKIEYPHKTIYILNDSYIAGKKNWLDYEILAENLGVHCITRKTPGGAKAGNINNALNHTKGEIIVIFDADMAAYPNFLKKTIPYFADEKIGFVQTPQYYANHEKNQVTGGAWEQQEFFFGPVMKGKDTSNAAFICGTNVAIRRKALEEVGGMNEKSIAEDFLTSLYIHQKGWKSKYLTEVLAIGLAPEDLLSYYKQQLRWARGSLEILFSHNPFFMRRLAVMQKIQYLSSALYYFNGPIVFIDMIMPLLALFFALTPVSATTTSFALFFVPFMFLNLFTLYIASEGRLTFRAISFSQASWTLQLKALFAVLTRQKTAFAVTPKKQQHGNFLSLAYPHILYIILGVAAFITAIVREGISASVAANASWVVFNALIFMPYIHASFAKEKIDNE